MIDFTDDDALITRLIASARAFTEKYCGIRIPTQTVELKCNCFADFARVPEAPVQEVASISYVDTAGVVQSLNTSVYELRADGLETSIVLKYGQSWPAIQQGSRITVTLDVGYDTTPSDIKYAMLLYIAGGYESRENGKAGDWTAFDSLLCNHRRNV